MMIKKNDSFVTLMPKNVNNNANIWTTGNNVWHWVNSHNLKFLNVYQNEIVFCLTLFRLDVGKK